MAKEMTLEQLLIKVREITDRDDFESYVNIRECEERIAKMEDYIDLDTELDEQMTEYIEKNALTDNKVCYVLFQLLFTVYRRKRYGNLEEYVNKYLCFFKQYPFSEFIELLMIYNVKKDDQHLNELLLRSKRLTESKGLTYDFTTHNGIINFYVEAVCTYFELNLDQRENEIGKKYIPDALDKIENVIASNPGKVYSKFLLNKGRLEILLGNYEIGEEYIIKAIQNIGFGVKRFFTVAEYEQFLTKLEMIKLYDKNNAKIKEVENSRVDNIKSLSLMTALLSFILGAINIFSEVKDIKVLALLMIMYFGLIMLLLGILLLGVKLLYNDKNKKFGLFNTFLLIFGILILLISIASILI